MKKLFFILCLIAMAIIVIINLSSCSKPNLAPIERSVTYLRHLYNDNGQYLATDTSIHWCRVGGEDLRMYEAKGNGEIKSEVASIADCWFFEVLNVADPLPPWYQLSEHKFD